MATNIMELGNFVQQGFRDGEARGTKNRLAELSQQAYGAQGAERQSLLGQMEGTQMGAGVAMGGDLQKQDDGRAKRYSGAARYLLNAIETKNPAAIQGAYQATMPAWQELAQGKPIPPQFGEDMLPMLHQVLAAGEGGGAQGNVQSTYVDAQGNRVAIMRDGSSQVIGQNAPNNQIIDTGNGFYGVNKGNLQAAPVQVGGQPQQGAPQPRAQGEVPFSIDPSLPPEVQASIRANESQWANAPEGGNVQIPQQGGQPQGGILTKAPDQAEQIRLQIAQQANQRAEEANMRAYDAAQRSARGNAPAGFRFKADGSLEPIPGGPKTAGATPTEGERGAAGYLQRMQAAEAEVTELAEKGYRPNLRDAYTAGEGALVNWAATDTGQVNRQQQEDWVRAKLRKESGAAIPAEEMDREIKTYFPQLGDSEAVIKSKARSRQTAIKQMEIIAGRAQGGVNAPAQPAQGGGVDDLLSKYGIR